ncbi:GTPase activating protein (GAP) for Rho1p [Malassezia caprae]|uniref:GTPase activating protein (GAP) for Rho1p n=1 Tax=Malassezia caprae TaxID=1381934 RepID=A0AAF0E963_9BASI|nr:GTPase activating protein (GAP) for Rho1p [Malassezia caprae]
MSRKFCRVMTKRDLEQSAKIEQYRRLIISIPQANQYLLLYILDLLAVVEHNSNKNKMTAQNLAIVFQPSILSHPNLSSKDEHLAAVEVIEFLIEHQDHFVLALSNPPPKDVPPEELTSQIPSEIEDYVIIPSDSDEEVSEYQWTINDYHLLQMQ